MDIQELLYLPSRTEKDIDYILFKLDLHYPRKTAEDMVSDIIPNWEKYNRVYRGPIIVYLLRLGIMTERLEKTCIQEAPEICFRYLQMSEGEAFDITSVESVIAQDPMWSIEYCRSVLKGKRFLLAEETLIRHKHYNKIYINLIKQHDI